MQRINRQFRQTPYKSPHKKKEDERWRGPASAVSEPEFLQFLPFFIIFFHFSSFFASQFLTPRCAMPALCPTATRQEIGPQPWSMGPIGNKVGLHMAQSKNFGENDPILAENDVFDGIG